MEQRLAHLAGNTVLRVVPDLTRPPLDRCTGDVRLPDDVEVPGPQQAAPRPGCQTTAGDNFLWLTLLLALRLARPDFTCERH
jgi:hypothetical protein